MHSRGFEETQAVYLSDPRRLIGQVRRFGDAGPAYEIIGVDDAGRVVTEVIVSGERVTCEIGEVLEDPMAETFP